jgi:ribulose-bisphosphate carboxylase small chain
MRVTQGTFSFLPDFTDEEIEGQLRYALSHGWAISVEHTDDAHPRNSYWEMWGLPRFDTNEEDVEVVMRDVRAAREAFPEHYIKVIAYDPSYTRQTTALAFIVNRPSVEQSFHLERTDDHDRVMRYRLKTVEPAADGRVELDASANGGAGSEGE